MHVVQGFVSLVGRVLLAAIFLASAVMNHIPHFGTITNILAGKGIPAPAVANAIATGLMLLGGVSLVLGYKGRLGALMLLIFLALASYYFHDFWHYEGHDKEQQMIHFMKNAAMMGAMLFIIANGPGAWSLDACYPSTPDTKAAP
jgi:putative oxidoreductase